MKNKLMIWGVFAALLLFCVPITAWAADNLVGVSYRGHIQDLGDYPRDGSWMDSPKIIGTTGQSKRIEGFEIKLTGTVPEGMELRYNVHVQNRGWLYDENNCAAWPKDGTYAGTRGECLRIEAVKIVLTDRTGKAVSGYSVQYRGHVQNVGDLPADKTQWLADGKQLGTVGSSLRLEALLVQVVKIGTDPVKPVEPQVYDKAGTYGPTTGTQTIAGDVTVAADGVVLQNLVLQGNLTISEAVGDGNVSLNNVTVKGDTLVRGGGVNSIKINGGEYSRIVLEKTASGAVRIVAIDVKGLPFFVSEAAAGETIILEGAFDSVTVNAPNMTVTTQGNTTTIGKMTVSEGAAGSTVTVAAGTTVSDLLLNGKAAIKGQGNVAKAEVKADGVVFDKKPGTYSIEPGVVIPPVFPPDSGGGYTPPTPIAVSGVSLNKMALTLSFNTSETLVATVAPANATNQAVTWTSGDDTIATVDATGKVTAVKEGQAIITVTSQDGNKTATCQVTVKDLKPAIGGVTAPFAGETPVKIIAATSQYSGTVSWQKKVGSDLTTLPDGETFDGTSTYQATITLTIKTPYTAADISENFFKVAGATTTNDVNTRVITAVFVPTDQYKITNDGSITAYSGPGGDVSVPATVNSTVVTGIGQDAFKNQTAINTITLPATVTAIGGMAFEGCTSLRAVTFAAAADLKTIGVAAFAKCKLLQSIAIPDQVTAIGPTAFLWCEKLNSVTFTANSALESIGANAFSNCVALTEITIPAKVTSLGNSAFFSCTALQKITILGHLTAIEVQTFQNCQALEAISIPASVTSIGVVAFQGCQKLTAISFRGAAPTLGTAAIDAGTTIKYYEKYTGFTTGDWVSYPKEVILAQPVLHTLSIVNDGNPQVTVSWYPVDNATAYDVFVSNTAGTYGDATQTVAGNVNTVDITGLDSSKSYYFVIKARDACGESLLSDEMKADLNIPVTSVSINPTAVTVNCGATTTLTAVLEPANAANKAVTWTSSDENVATVGSDGTVTAVSEGEATIKALTTDGGKEATCAVTVTSLFQIDGSGLITSYAGPGGEVTIPDQVNNTAVKGIGANVFNQYLYRNMLTGISIPAAVTIIKEGAFHYCSNLSSVTFRGQSQLTTLEKDAFSGCALTSIALPEGLESIGDYAFNVNKLNSLTIPGSVTSIGDSAFCQNNLSSLVIADGNSLSIANCAFSGNPLTAITLPDNVTIYNTPDTMGKNGAGFIAAYANNGGTYNYTSGTTPAWTRQP